MGVSITISSWDQICRHRHLLEMEKMFYRNIMLLIEDEWRYPEFPGCRDLDVRASSGLADLGHGHSAVEMRPCHQCRELPYLSRPAATRLPLAHLFGAYNRKYCSESARLVLTDSFHRRVRSSPSSSMRLPVFHHSMRRRRSLHH
jgi:hypothetical protein